MCPEFWVHIKRQTVELKSCAGGFPKKIYDTLSSFSNQDSGGIIIFGMNDKPSYDICGGYNPEDVQRKIMENCCCGGNTSSRSCNSSSLLCR